MSIKLVDILRDPHQSQGLSLNQWSELVSEARFFSMLSQLRSVFTGAGIWDEIPNAAKTAIQSDIYTSKNQRRLLEIEARELSTIFTQANITFTYLKGAAYQLMHLKPFTGRLMADIDVLVAKQDLAKAEQILLSNMWMSSSVTDYDDKFYREWSQEIPPMRHFERGTELDVHFNILPTILKNAPDASYLLSQTQVLPDYPNASHLKPSALTFHSMVHLFFESEYHKGIRDLYDLKLLIEHFESDSFWQDLMALDQQARNGDCVYLALRYCHRVFGVQVPAEVSAHYEQYKYNEPVQSLIDWSFIRVFCRYYPKHQLPLHSVAEAVLYWRGHLKRMPWYRLIPHLLKKSWRKIFEEEEKSIGSMFDEQ
ncbi:nucleotidyltransferase family protein [Echinimonas agarilytica]|uniref:Nucleotidyltransferase family protein n=1 Tax=Echinimonas agarilytica TaxID=1215918 RepID=A0AA41WCT3_9GAMM|nr:nucleotidyltransferase family protein [Echinimonas agarilytica]MCM2681464.1 nucleotidyltransferase family protein [Echinimonas agarilytica]